MVKGMMASLAALDPRGMLWPEVECDVGICPVVTCLVAGGADVALAKIVCALILSGDGGALAADCPVAVGYPVLAPGLARSVDPCRGGGPFACGNTLSTVGGADSVSRRVVVLLTGMALTSGCDVVVLISGMETRDGGGAFGLGSLAVGDGLTDWGKCDDRLPTLDAESSGKMSSWSRAVKRISIPEDEATDEAGLDCVGTGGGPNAAGTGGGMSEYCLRSLRCCRFAP